MTYEQAENNEQDSWQNAAYSNIIGNKALLRILVRKGLITEQEFSSEVQKVHQAFMDKQQNQD
jgi:hypothetical protein